ncbi:MAG: DUF4396 domain-containing protein [Simkaniaceae bacterium]|nr:DUF4396 domain-containing protein [Simkaniaceae bacterium]
MLTILSTAYVLYDQLTNTPSMRIMTLAWVLVLLYTGPVGLFFYFTSCRQPMPGTHDEFIKPHWKQALGSEIHCVAGDATAIILSALVLSFYELPNGLESVIEYVVAYLFGLLIFQALFMRGMFGSYAEAVVKSVFAETVSMNFVMAGMLPTIMVIKHAAPAASDPGGLLFWGTMSVATLVGSLLAYPINSWMVARGIKHGMMSMSGEMHHHHQHAERLSLGKQWTIVIATFLFLFAITWITSLFIPIVFFST